MSGSVRAMSDGSTGKLAGNNYAYTAFGVGTASGSGGGGTASNTAANANNREWGGQQQDPTGLYYTGCGYYYAQLGRSIGGGGG